MSKPWQKFIENALQADITKRIFRNHTPGKRIAPPQARDLDAKHQFRLDAGEVHNGAKTIYLQVNAEAKNDKLKEFQRKNGSHANLAVGTIDENTPLELQRAAVEQMLEDMTEQVEEKLK